MDGMLPEKIKQEIQEMALFLSREEGVINLLLDIICWSYGVNLWGFLDQ